MRAYLLAWDAKHFSLSLIKGSPMFVYFAEENARLLTGKKIYSIFQEPCQEVVEFIGSYGIFTGAGRF